MNKKQHGFTAVEGLLIVLILSVIGFGGYYVWNNQHKTKSVSTSSTPKPTISNFNECQNSAGSTIQQTYPEVCVTKDGKSFTQTTTDQYAGWLQYCSEQEKSCFKYPNDWTLSKTEFGEIKITSTKDTTLVFWADVSGIGGACDPSTEPHFFYDKIIPVPRVPGSYIVEQSLKDNPNSASIGIKESANGQPPKLGDSGSCFGDLSFKSHQDSSRIVWFKGGNKTQSAITDLDTALKILESYYYQ